MAEPLVIKTNQTLDYGSYYPTNINNKPKFKIITCGESDMMYAEMAKSNDNGQQKTLDYMSFKETQHIVSNVVTTNDCSNNIDTISEYIESMGKYRQYILNLLNEIISYWPNQQRYIEIEDDVVKVFIRKTNVIELFQEFDTFVKNNRQTVAKCGIRFLITTDFVNV